MKLVNSVFANETKVDRADSARRSKGVESDRAAKGTLTDTDKENTMAMTANGISTTTAPGQEQYEYFRTPKRPGKPGQKRVQYDYRHTDGELFSCVAPTLEAARARRDEWLALKAA